MKKLLIIIGLAVSTAVFADSGVEFETGTEHGHFAPNLTGPVVHNNWVAVTPWTEWGNGWDAGIKFEGARDTTPGASLENKIELRVRKSIELTDKLGVGLRVGVGEDFNQQSPTTQTHDFAYYLLEPRATYQLSESATGVVSYRYRNAFVTGNYFQSNTYKVGIDYKVTDTDEVGFRITNKVNADERAQGLELTYSRSF